MEEGKLVMVGRKSAGHLSYKWSVLSAGSAIKRSSTKFSATNVGLYRASFMDVLAERLDVGCPERRAAGGVATNVRVFCINGPTRLGGVLEQEDSTGRVIAR